jgi:hypothetical protein
LNYNAFNAQSQTISSTLANPITITSSNSAVTLSVNSGTPSTSVILSSGAQVLSLGYSGLAIIPVTLKAAATGMTTQSVTFAPAIQSVVYAGPTSSPEIDLYATSGTGSTYNFTAGQPGWTGSFGQSLTVTGASNCSTFASIATPAPAATNFTVTAVASPVPGTCTLGIGGFSSSINVTITYTTFGVIFH